MCALCRHGFPPASQSLPPSPSVPGSADALLRSYFPDGMSESLMAYLLHGVLKALEYLHQMGYVHRWVGRGGWVGMRAV